MIPKNLGELLRQACRLRPQKTAIVFGTKLITYKHLNELTDFIAAGLVELGIKRQDKVALFLDNCPEFIISYYAILKAGGVVVPINYMLKTEEAKFIIEDSEAVCLITSRAYTDMAEELRARIDNLRYVITTAKVKEEIPDLNRLRSHKRGLLEGISPEPDSLAVILYTSGTMGKPKGAMLSHYNLISNAGDSAGAIKATAKDSVICILPLFHSFAATVCMNMPLLVGAKIVVMKSLKPFRRLIRAIRRNRVTIFAAIPSVFGILKDFKIPRILRTPLIKVLNPVRLCICGAAALPADVLCGFEKKFRIPLLEGYGLTEAAPVVTLNPFRGIRKPGSIGKSLSMNIELKIVDDNNNALGPGQVGELLVKGPNVMMGYLKQKEATLEAIRGQWLYTGDMARLDENGYIYIAGRRKEMVNVRGMNVYPREIEDMLYQNPKVKEAAVIGIPDAHKGEVPKAFVVLKDSCVATEHEIIQCLRERMAGYKIPKYVEFRTALPKNTTGKILKRILQDEEAKK